MVNLARCSVSILVVLFEILIFAVQTETVSVIQAVDADTIFIRDSQGQLVLSYIY